jgi:hypothetical protein
MRLNHFVLRKLQTLLQMSADASRKIAAAADPMAKRRYRPLFPLYTAAVTEAAADKSAKHSGSSRASRRANQRISMP